MRLRTFTQHLRPAARARRVWGAWRKRATAAGLLFSYLVGATGVLLPVAPPVQTAEQGATTERFPCEKRVCGCGGGEHCWTQCHCQTLTEKLAWARRTGVRPPAVALRLATRQGINVSEWKRASANPVQTSPTSTNVVAMDSASPKCACCAAAGRKSKSTTPEPESPQIESNDGRPVILSQALACKGISYQWMSVGEVITPAADASLFHLDRSNESTCILVLHRGSVRFNPDPPPPQSV